MKLSGSQDKVVNSTNSKKNESKFASIPTSKFSFSGSNNDHALDGETFHIKDRLICSNT